MTLAVSLVRRQVLDLLHPDGPHTSRDQRIGSGAPRRRVSQCCPSSACRRGLCATCYTLYTPTVDATGAVVGQLPEQTPYLEWEHSSYGDGVGEDRSCQQCHMPAAAGPAVISNRPGGGQLSPRSPFAQHYFVGANVFMLELLKARIDELELTTSTTNLDATIQRTNALVQARAAQLSMSTAGSTVERSPPWSTSRA